MRSQHSIRVWGYATDDGDMAITADADKATKWRELFHDRGESGPFEFVLTPSARSWNKSKNEIAEMRRARRENKEAGRG